MAEVQGRHNPTKVGLSCQSWENWDFPGSPWVRIPVLPLQEARVRALVEEQRSSMPGLRVRKKKKKPRTLSYGMETHALQVLTPGDSALGSLDVAPSRSY